MERLVAILTTDASGDATGYLEPTQPGFIRAIRYVKTDYADGIDITITGETSGLSILSVTDMNASATYVPQTPTHDLSAAAENYNDESDEAVNAPIPICDERIKIVIANGGDTKAGTFHVWVG